ncbi:hypothetical protein M404DRAFT_203463 [Pisolithus tinctorius Marx 270]|uniref:Uncharacterized protein n=1 Tax=Pisolithus tinctorius Marx 270 TaxID=870435 RepID=A0A0C3L008_PISTI|nr:hypothetical protein M404DRAFT_203463 [Pisolithus tinctorius Marx 270]
MNTTITHWNSGTRSQICTRPHHTFIVLRAKQCQTLATLSVCPPSPYISCLLTAIHNDDDGLLTTSYRREAVKTLISQPHGFCAQFTFIQHTHHAVKTCSAYTSLFACSFSTATLE